MCCKSIRYSVSSATVIVLRVDFGDDPSAVEHDQPVRHLVHMRQIVFDIDAGAPGLFDLAHEVDHFSHLRDAERGGRLVEHDEVGVVVHRPADRDALALAARELADRRIDRDADAAEADHVDQDLPARPPSRA